MPRRVVVLLLSVTLVAACGDDDGESASTASTSVEAVTTTRGGDGTVVTGPPSTTTTAAGPAVTAVAPPENPDNPAPTGDPDVTAPDLHTEDAAYFQVSVSGPRAELTFTSDDPGAEPATCSVASDVNEEGRGVSYLMTSRGESRAAPVVELRVERTDVDPYVAVEVFETEASLASGDPDATYVYSPGDVGSGEVEVFLDGSGATFDLVAEDRSSLSEPGGERIAVAGYVTCPT